MRVVAAAGEVPGADVPQADVAVVDVDLPDGSGFELCQALATRAPRMTVLALVNWDWDSYLVGARAAGACGILLRSRPTRALVEGIVKAAAGPIFTREQVKRMQKWDEDFGLPFRAFRPREWQVFWLAADGLNNRSIAAGLDLSENMVEKHMTGILDKFGLSSRSLLLTLVYNQHLDVLRGVDNNRLLTFP